jgi:hypothetical protein
MGKHKTQHSMRLQNIILTFLLFGLISCNSTDSIFTDETYQDTIKQSISGLLIREIHHYNDFNSFNYDIEYSYKDKNDSIRKIGLGSFYGQEPPKDEQLIRIDKWTVLKTSGDRDKDFLYIGNSNNIWTKYEISPETIEQQDLWKAQKIETRTDNWDSVSKVKKIDSNGNVTVVYTFVREKFIPFFKTGKRKLIYSLNKITGRLEMTKISEN